MLPAERASVGQVWNSLNEKSSAKVANGFPKGMHSAMNGQRSRRTG